MDAVQAEVLEWQTLVMTVANILLDTLQSIRADLRENLPQYLEALCQVDPTRVAAHLASHEYFSRGISNRMVKVRTMVGAKTAASLPPSPAPSIITPSAPTHHVSTSHLPRLEPLKFSG